MIRGFVAGEDLEGLSDEFLDDLLPQMVAAVDAGTAILAEEWRSVASRPAGSGRLYRGGHRAAAPGEPLTRLSGAYLRAIEIGAAKRKGSRVEGYVVNRAPGAARDEFGGKDRRGVYVPPHPTARVAEANAAPRILEAMDTRLGVA